MYVIAPTVDFFAASVWVVILPYISNIFFRILGMVPVSKPVSSSMRSDMHSSCTAALICWIIVPTNRFYRLNSFTSSLFWCMVSIIFNYGHLHKGAGVIGTDYCGGWVDAGIFSHICN